MVRRTDMSVCLSSAGGGSLSLSIFILSLPTPPHSLHLYSYITEQTDGEQLSSVPDGEPTEQPDGEQLSSSTASN